MTVTIWQHGDNKAATNVEVVACHQTGGNVYLWTKDGKCTITGFDRLMITS